MTADPRVRACRRYDELRAKGAPVSLEEIERNVRERDRADMSRAVSPQRQAPAAVVLDNRRMNLGEIAPRDLPNGVKYLGHLNDPSLDMYVYGEVYYDDWTNPDAPETKPLIPDNMIILISSRPNYMMAYGACTYIEDASGLWVTSQTSRVLRSYVEHHPDRRMVELPAHPLPIPDKVDSWLVATVC